jgi:hypothetical protein
MIGRNLAVLAVYCGPVSDGNSLLTGKITGNFACFDGSNYALFLGNPRSEPIFSHHNYFRRKSEQGINRERIRELTGAYQGKNRDLFLEATGPLI